jgi:L-lactate dehydrogenase
VSIYDEKSKVCLSKPVVLGRKGVEQVLELPLNDEEKDALAKSSKSLREVIEEAEKAEKK